MTDVHVDHITPVAGSGAWLGQGHDANTGEIIEFLGDWRPMRDIREALDSGETIHVELEGWQIVARYQLGAEGASDGH